MGRKPTVSDEDIRAVADRLIRERKDTVKAVQAAIGGGSSKRVSEILAERRAALAEESRIEVQLESSDGVKDVRLGEEVSHLIHALPYAIAEEFDRIVQGEDRRHRQVFEAIEREHKTQLAGKDSLLREAEETNGGLEEQLKAVNTELEALRKDLSSRGRESSRREAAWTKEREQKEARIEGLQAELSEARAEIARLVAERDGARLEADRLHELALGRLDGPGATASEVS